MSDKTVLTGDEKRAIEMSQIVGACCHRLENMMKEGEACVVVIAVGRHEPGAYNFSGGARQTHANLAADPEKIMREAVFELAHEMAPTIKATLAAGALTVVDTDQDTKLKTNH